MISCPGVVNTLQAEWAARQNEDPAITSQREEYLAKLYAAAPDDSPIKSTLNELWNGEKQEKLPGWVRLLDDSTDYGLRGEFNKDGTPTGNINLQGLNQLKPTLDIAGMGIRGERTRTLQDQINQTNFEGEIDPAAGDVVDDQGRVWKRDPNTNTLTLAPNTPAPAGLNTITPVAPAGPIRRNVENPNEMESRMLAEALARQQAATQEQSGLSSIQPAPPSNASNPSPSSETEPALPPAPPSLPSSQSETAPALPPIQRPDTTVVVGSTPVETVTDRSKAHLDAMNSLAEQASQSVQTPAPTPTLPTPVQPDSTPAASSPVSAPSQDSLNAPVVGEAGSVAQMETSTPAPAATGPAIQPTTENANGLQAEAQTEAPLNSP
jgi:hypothetical protein